ncbi:hypothetical protein CA983_13275 [Streptomyces swartbergensis]|uniref:Uncharacterized protein n=1 Tax=Streptomyces swartbergensis TaxID=487165 RepID=A0A243S5E4_9ACTN|nr:hypothetical protein CA983_13275 [Streptomyces swartbergensis]
MTMSIQLMTAAEGYSVQGRGPSIAADLVALASVAIGALALARAKGRIGTGNGRTGAIVAMAVGLTGMILAGVALAIADGGPGTGNGVVGSVFALVLGLLGMALGGRARARSRRAGLPADGLPG